MPKKYFSCDKLYFFIYSKFFVFLFRRDFYFDNEDTDTFSLFFSSERSLYLSPALFAVFCFYFFRKILITFTYFFSNLSLFFDNLFSTIFIIMQKNYKIKLLVIYHFFIYAKIFLKNSFYNL